MVGENSIGILAAWRSFQALGILKHLSIGRASIRRLLFCGFAALILHLAAVEAHVALRSVGRPGSLI